MFVLCDSATNPFACPKARIESNRMKKGCYRQSKEILRGKKREKGRDDGRMEIMVSPAAQNCDRLGGTA